MRAIKIPAELATALYKMLGAAINSTQDLDETLDIMQDMQYTNAIEKDLHIICPHCKRTLQPIHEDTTAHNFPMKCRRCGKFFELNI